jgi:methionyl-tRNA formyltransferase
VFDGKHREIVQDESQASYEGWCRETEARVHWGHHVDAVYDLIRGCNPAPGAWTTFGGRKLELYDARKHRFRRFADVVGKVGEVSDVTDTSFKVTAQGGRIEVLRARAADGKKASGGDVAKTLGLASGAVLGD